MPGGGEPPRAGARRILSTQVGSDPFRKFSTLLDFSMAYKSTELRQDDPICTVLIVELLQFYYSTSDPLRTPPFRGSGVAHWICAKCYADTAFQTMTTPSVIFVCMAAIFSVLVWADTRLLVRDVNSEPTGQYTSLWRWHKGWSRHRGLFPTADWDCALQGAWL